MSTSVRSRRSTAGNKLRKLLDEEHLKGGGGTDDIEDIEFEDKKG